MGISLCCSWCKYYIHANSDAWSSSRFVFQLSAFIIKLIWTMKLVWQSPLTMWITLTDVNISAAKPTSLVGAVFLNLLLGKSALLLLHLCRTEITQNWYNLGFCPKRPFSLWLSWIVSASHYSCILLSLEVFNQPRPVASNELVFLETTAVK